MKIINNPGTAGGRGNHPHIKHNIYSSFNTKSQMTNEDIHQKSYLNMLVDNSYVKAP
jgi:hypothetical protein